MIHKITVADVYVLLDTVQFQKGDFANRNRIKSGSGPIWLTIPVLHEGHLDKTFRDLRINNQVRWQEKHLKSIHMAYSKAPFFRHYIGLFEDLYDRDWTYLWEVAEFSLRRLLDTLGVTVEFLRASDLGVAGRRQDLLLDLCRRVGANVHFFGVSGRDYVDVARFEAGRVRAAFQDFQHPTYPQLYGEFVPNLSVVDLLFNCGPRSLQVILQGNVTRSQLLEVACGTFPSATGLEATSNEQQQHWRLQS